MSIRWVELSTKVLEPNELTLTCKGMSSVNWDCSDSDFEFVFGRDRVCRVHSVLAEFLSPKVASVRKGDSFCSFYTFKDSEVFNVLESLVSNLRSGDAFRVETSNFAALLGLAQELENAELLSSLLGMIKTESLSLQEAILLLRVGIDLGAAFCDRFGNLRDLIASSFYEIEKKILDDLDLETTQILLSSPSLKIEDEDSLYDFVRSRSENDLGFASLFEFIYFDYLSVNRIENFASFVSEKLLENISSGLWTRICRRLILETKLKTNPRALAARPNEKNSQICGNNDAVKKVATAESDSSAVVQLIVHVERAEGLVSLKDEPPDTYVKIEIDGNKKSGQKSNVVQNNASPVWDQELKIESSNPDGDTLIITVVGKDVARDEPVSDKIKIPFKEFLPVGKQEERVIDLKLKKKAAGKLYLNFASSPGNAQADVVEGPIGKKSHKKNGDEKKSSDKHKKKWSDKDEKK